jgi:Amylo-alpha-1,6-glucosidase
VVEKVEQHLLTHSGIAPSHQATHDTVDPIPAALQSTMEPTPRELFGRGCWEPFITAYIKDEWRKEEARRQAQAWLSPLESHLTEGGLGHVSEIFEGDAPHRPCGCIAQAWSVAEIPHLYSEELRGLWPNTRPCGHAAQSKNRSEGPQSSSM